MILAADTSLPLLTVALVSDRSTIGMIALEGRQSRNEKLLPSIDWLLEEAGARRDSIELFVVTRGPGSFTGVRIGLATIQGLAFAMSKPICAMSTHEALALGGPWGRSRLLVSSEAGRGERYVSGYEDGREVLAPTLMSSDALEALRAGYEHLIDAEAEIEHRNVARMAAARAEDLLVSGRIRAYADVTPIYVRPSEAEARLAGRTDD